MLGMKKLAIAGAAMLVLAGLPGTIRALQETTDPQQVTAGPQRIEMTVLGMSCPFCAYGLEKKLRKVEGVTELRVDYKTGKVVLDLRDGSKATDQRLRELVKDAGFEVTEITRFPLPQAPKGEEEPGA